MSAQDGSTTAIYIIIGMMVFVLAIYGILSYRCRHCGSWFTLVESDVRHCPDNTYDVKRTCSNCQSSAWHEEQDYDEFSRPADEQTTHGSPGRMWTWKL